MPPVRLAGGDLFRTLGGGDRVGGLPRHLVFSIDLGQVLADGKLYVFLAHLVARSRLWTRAVVAMNAQWYGAWNLGPRAHPNDGLLDVYDASLRASDLLPIRSRLRQGAHLPHPRIRERRTAAVQLDLGRRMAIRLDGEAVGAAQRLSIRADPDALTVWL